MESIIVLSLFFSSVSALAFDAPKPTPTWAGFSIDTHGRSPKPTTAPSMAELLRRQQQFSDVIMGPDGTCGFVSGSSASPFGLCCDTCSCGFKTYSTGLGDLYCCNSANCERRQPTTCIDAFTYSVLKSCDSKCANDPVTIVCTASPYTYCNIALFNPVDVEALFCDSTSVSTIQTMILTYSDEKDRTFTPFSGPSQTGSSAASSSTSLSSGTSSSSSSSQSSTPSSTSITATANQGSQSSTTPPAAAKKSTPVGAVVGGSVGGVAFLAFAILLILYRMRKSHNSASDSVKAESYATPLPPATDSNQPYYKAPQTNNTGYAGAEGSLYNQQSGDFPHSYVQDGIQQQQQPYDPHMSYLSTSTTTPQSPYRPPPAPLEMEAAPAPVELHNTSQPAPAQHSPTPQYKAYSPPKAT